MPDSFHRYAITDATVPANANDIKSIWLCPLFFTGDDTKNDLPSSEDEEALKTWCDQKDYTFFPTAGESYIKLASTLSLPNADAKGKKGHVLLHEITHLDAVAKLFPLESVLNLFRSLFPLSFDRWDEL